MPILQIFIHLRRETKVLLFGIIYVLSSFGCPVFSQNPADDLYLSFVKDTDNITSSELHFNALKIINTTQHIITGNLKFNLPDGWRALTATDNKLKINPLDTIFVPVRVSPVYDALGNITYILNATLKTPDRTYTANTYLTIPEINSWTIDAEKSNIYVSDEFPESSLIVKLSNKGNTNELIRLDFQPGKLIELENKALKDIITNYINLPAYHDTTIVKPFSYNVKLNYLDKIRLENSWRESTVIITASTENKKVVVSNIIKKLNSKYTNQKNQRSSPLNFDYNIYNIMSNQEVRNNINIFGDVLLANNREIQYNTGLQNIYFSNSNNNFNINRQLIYNVKYADKWNNIALGYNIYGGNLHSINGRGIVGSFNPDRKNNVSYAFIQNPFTNSIGANAGYSRALTNASVNAEVTYEANLDKSYNAKSVLAGVGFNIFKYHNFSFQLLGSQANYLLNNNKDTSLLGISYRFTYNVQYRNFDLHLSGFNSSLNYIQNSGLQQYYLDSRFVVTDKIRLALYGTRNYYSSVRYPYNLFNPANFNSTDNVRLTAIYTDKGITYQFGPNYVGTVRQQHNLLSTYSTEYTTFQPGVWGSISVRIDPSKSISPNITLSNMRFNYKTDNPDLTNYSANQGIYYTIGLNYNDNNWKVNTYYSSGSISDIYRSVEIYNKPKSTKSIQIRPVYENYFMNKTIKISAFMNYAYYLPSERQNITYNVKYDHFFKKGWNLYVSGYVFSNTRNDETTGKVSTVDMNLIVGLSKSFNIQQPRSKYYNVKTVFFNDLDGNRVKSDNEPPVPNILVNLVKDKASPVSQSNMPEINMVSDKNGEIYIENLPKDTYKMTFSPLVNLESYYFLNGSSQSVFNNSDRIMFVPLVESYKIKGKVVLVRDPNSSEGRIDLDGIRITAIGQNKEVYSVLTDKSGAYILNVPNGDKYLLKINNIFGDQFSIDADEVQIQFTKNKTVNLDFIFTEKRREINFGNGNQLFKFNINNSQNNNTQE